MRRYAVLLVVLLAACGKSEAPADAAKKGTAAAEMPPEATPVDAGVDYISSCTFTDEAQPTRFVKVVVSLGSAIPKSSEEYANTVGDRSGTLRKPATPITTLAVPVIEMDGGPDFQAMQARLEQFVELTVTTQSMDLTRSLFPPALVALRAKLPDV